MRASSEGSQFLTGDVHQGIIHYQVLCRKHYRLGQLGPEVARA
jgi:hypothetical protein